VDWNQIYPGDFAGLSQSNSDHWGCLWERTDQHNMGQIARHPLEEWSDLDCYEWPDPDDPAFYEGMEVQFENAEGKYVLIGYFMLLYERMWALRGFENNLIDLLTRRDKSEHLADRIMEFFFRWVENVKRRFPESIHGVHFSDDWGTQQSLMINPDLWRDFFKPRYKRMFAAMREAGWHVWMHSDGKINDILDDLIDIGVDSINLQQPRLNGITEIGRRFRGRICFESLCDIQSTLPFKNDKEIRQEAHMLLEQWSTSEGGFILSDYGEGRAIGVPPEKKRVMLDAFLEMDPWKS
jgi:uroporphyrinogen-III decarboxylase